MLEPDDEPQKPAPKIDLNRLQELEETLLAKVEKKAELKKLEEQADAEMQETYQSGSAEQILLMVGAAIMILSLPFTHYLLAIILTLFVVVISLVAGFTSPKQPFSPTLNLAVSLVALIIFEYSAIYTFNVSSGLDSSFWLYQFLAFIFLFCTFFSMRTYRKRILE